MSLNKLPFICFPLLISTASLSSIFVILFLKYQDNIEEWVINKITKGKKEKKNTSIKTENNEKKQ